MVKNGIDFLGYRHILNSSGKIIVKLRYSSKRRLKKHLKTVNKLYNKGQLMMNMYIKKTLFIIILKTQMRVQNLKLTHFPSNRQKTL